MISDMALIIGGDARATEIHGILSDLNRIGVSVYSNYDIYDREGLHIWCDCPEDAVDKVKEIRNVSIDWATMAEDQGVL